MKAKKLSDADLALMAKHWWQQHDKPLEPWPEPFKTVRRTTDSVSVIAAAIHDALVESGGIIEFEPHGRCMNCGEHKAEVRENGGWCDLCSGVTVPESPCLCGCLAEQPPPSAYVDYWAWREGDK